MEKLRVIIRGAYGDGNFGDDVLMIVCYRLLRRLYDADQIAIRFRSHAATLERAYVHRLIPGTKVVCGKSEPQADLVVWGGGTQFFSFVPTHASMTLGEKVVSALLHPRRSVTFLIRNALRETFTVRQRFVGRQRFAALGIGVGPFLNGSAGERDTRRLFGTMNFVAVRDPNSLALCREWGVKNVTLRSDLSFLLDTWWPQGVSAGRSRRSHGGVGVIVRDWPHDAEGSAYSQPLWRVVETLRAKGIAVTFISFCPDGDVGWISILKSRGEVLVSWEPERQSIANFLEKLRAFDCLLTARYHGALLGAMLGKPIICIEVEQKLRLVSELLSGFLWRKPFHEEECLALIDRVFQDYDDLVAQTEKAVKHQRRLAFSMQEEFLAFATPRDGRSAQPR